MLEQEDCGRSDGQWSRHTLTEGVEEMAMPPGGEKTTQHFSEIPPEEEEERGVGLCANF